MTQLLPKPKESPEVGLPGKIKRKARPRLLVVIGLVVAIGSGVAWYFLSRTPANELEFSGRIEGYESDIGTKVSGRVEEVTVREGAEVEPGELLVRLDDDELQAELEGAEARLQAARQEEENARLQVAVLESQITENQYRLQQSQGNTQGEVAQAEAQLAAATAQLRQAEAQAIEAQSQLELARTDRDRYAQLVQQGVVSQQRYDQAQAAFESAQAVVESRQASVTAAQRQVAAAEGQLTQARTSTLNPNINEAQLERLNTQLEQTRALRAAAQAEVANAEATRQQIQAQLNNLTIVSPIEGVVTTRTVEPGVVVSPGNVLLSVLDFDTVYMRGFIPEGEIGRIRVGQPALVYLDSFPDRPLEAEVAAIDSEASFTPENIYFKDDRVQQVFGVRLALKDPDGFAKPGMPADAEIVLESNE
ncbi:MAG: HlyD family efflux transporter periplasmic adaptor subunit [Elainellaceae cyanobacterium]